MVVVLSEHSEELINVLLYCPRHPLFSVDACHVALDESPEVISGSLVVKRDVFFDHTWVCMGIDVECQDITLSLVVLI